MHYLLKNILANRHAAHPFVASLLTTMCPPPTDKCSSVSATCAWVTQAQTGPLYILSIYPVHIHEIFIPFSREGGGK